jgi:arylsulfatase B
MMLLLLLLLLLRALWAAAAAAAAAPQQQRRRATRASGTSSLLADDYGWADAGWHAKMEPAPPTSTPDPRADVRTPVLDSLVSASIELQRNYVFAVCSPTRSGIQTGRNPYIWPVINFQERDGGRTIKL